MITLIVSALVKPENLTDFIEETKIAQQATLEEGGCTAYTINKDNEDEDSIILIESYLSEDAINFHKNTPYFLEWRDKIRPFIITRTTEKFISL